MAADSVSLSGPPRTVMAAGDGAAMIELEDRVAVVRQGMSIVTDVCIPEEKGERLLWPVGLARCVMLGSKGLLTLYEGPRALEKHPGVLLEGDELIETMDAGNEARVILVGRSTGDELLLPTPEYRFVWVGAKFELLGREKFVSPRRPLAWGVNSRTKSVLLLAAHMEGENLITVAADANTPKPA